MENSVSERIKTFVASKNLSMRKFEMECGLTNGLIANCGKGLNTESLAKIIARYPDLDLFWLITGEKRDDHTSSRVDAESPSNGQIEGENDYLRTVVKSQQALIKSQQDMINAMMQVKGI